MSDTPLIQFSHDRRIKLPSVLALLLQNHLPSGYVLQTSRMLPGALIRIAPMQPKEGDYSVQVLYDVSREIGAPENHVNEQLRVSWDVMFLGTWKDASKIVKRCCQFSLRHAQPAASDMEEIRHGLAQCVAEICAAAPFVKLSWETCPKDSLKKILIHGDKPVSSVWRYTSQSSWGSRSGNSFQNVKTAMEDTESRIKDQIRSQHQLRAMDLIPRTY